VLIGVRTVHHDVRLRGGGCRSLRHERTNCFFLQGNTEIKITKFRQEIQKFIIHDEKNHVLNNEVDEKLLYFHWFNFTTIRAPNKPVILKRSIVSLGRIIKVHRLKTSPCVSLRCYLVIDCVLLGVMRYFEL